VGFSLYLAQAVGVSFYISGFAESVYALVPQIPPQIVGVVTLLLLTTLAYISADLALRAQVFIFVIIIFSLVSIFAGGPPEGGFTSYASGHIETAPFWVVFAVFFPAVTGILAGVSMSGDLKNPGRALPIGTLLSVLTGLAVYIAIPIFLDSIVPQGELIKNSMVMQDIAFWGWIVVLGIWGATLSSALGGLLAGPRTLQALAKDRIVSSYLGKGHGETNEPRIATAVSFFIALGAVLLGDLDTIAPVLSMFFLTAYGSLNLIAGLEGFMANPSWRPKLRVHPLISLTGAFLCFATMLMINAGATFIALFVVVLIYVVTAKRRLGSRWADIRRGMLMSLAKYSIYRLTDSRANARSWRPNLLVLSGAPTKRLELVELADAISHGKGFLTVASILKEDQVAAEKVAPFERLIRKFLKDKKIPSLVEVLRAPSVENGIKQLISIYGIGPVVPNTYLLGECQKDDMLAEHASMIKQISGARKNIVLVQTGEKKKTKVKRKQIHCWWGDDKNSSWLMLVLAYQLTTSTEWRRSDLTVRTFAESELERRNMLSKLQHDFVEARIAADIEVLIEEPSKDKRFDLIRKFSEKADLLFTEMKPPSPEQSLESFSDYYKTEMAQTRIFPTTAYVLACEKMHFEDIFN